MVSYPSSSGKKKAVEVSIKIRILKFIRVSVHGTNTEKQGTPNNPLHVEKYL
jgi:hypothetical protein